MIPPMRALTIVHVLISLVGIGSGFVVLWGLLISRRLRSWTALFLTTTVGTSATGFLFPIHKVTPGIVLGVISLVLLAVAIWALYVFHLSGAWRPTYVITVVLSLYLNVLVLIVQLFQKVPSLKALAPTQSEPPFQITQLVVLIVFVVLGIAATIRFRPVLLRDANV